MKTFHASADLVRKMNQEMQRDGYELDHAAMQALASLIDECMEVDDEGGTAINFLHALSKGARAAAEWAEAELA